jgi:hypothetical protein
MRLDYFIGRTFDGVVISKADDREWSIRLSGDAMIGNHDGRRKKPDDEILTGTSLLNVINAERTVLQFGRNFADGSSEVVAEIELTPTLYSISDPVHTANRLVLPGKPEQEVDPLPPDPSADRVVDGPESDPTALEAPEVGL